MEGRSWCNGELGDIKKGPWKVEEDEVLLNHVNKYGPRDWSSIRSKGLLQRTGKSCRLRWVNKLRPNLKNGVKFSAEEERIVIDLQAQFGNKWARIATYLPGRTDNDVKNFWSSRQKRLARILHNSTPQSSKSRGDSNSGSSVKEVPALLDVPSLEEPKFRSSANEESLSKPQSCSSSYIENFEAIPMLDLMNPTSFTFEPNLLQLEYAQCETKPFHGSQPQLPFPQVQTTDFSLPPLEGQDFASRLGDLNFFDAFGNTSGPEPETSCEGVVKQESDAVINPLSPDSFIDDFSIDMFDHIEPLPSPSDW
ncbi:transcription factor DUO1-like isoform X1 [Ipomoea triloba]|uniref:transcription factor DUO1-like isoform X1 n=1 Tax=Ipomoea triloba TaxID=35885 RepID=UPI00125CFBF3|nr:transcription factor DUO1-like isoform X1 [Ipomoea triloba]